MNINNRPPYSHSFMASSMISHSNFDHNLITISNKKLENINCVFKPKQYEGGLYIGDIISTMKQQILKKYNIQAILTCMSEKISMRNQIKEHKIITIKDTLDYPIINHFDECVNWIEQKRRQKLNVLVHCHAGVSRSATIIIAYLIRTQRWNPIQSLQFLRQQRERVKPNNNFWSQINQYYEYWNKQIFNPLENRGRLKENELSDGNKNEINHLQFIKIPSKQIKKELQPQKIHINKKPEEQKLTQMLRKPIALKKRLFQNNKDICIQVNKTKRDEIISSFFKQVSRQNQQNIRPNTINFQQNLHKSAIIEPKKDLSLQKNNGNLLYSPFITYQSQSIKSQANHIGSIKFS